MNPKKLEEAIAEAVKYCEENQVLQSFLKEHASQNFSLREKPHCVRPHLSLRFTGGREHADNRICDGRRHRGMERGRPRRRH